LRSVLFRVITEHMVIIPYRRFGTTYLSDRDGTDRLSRTSARTYHYTLRNSSQEHRSLLLRIGSLKSHYKLSFKAGLQAEIRTPSPSNTKQGSCLFERRSINCPSELKETNWIPNPLDDNGVLEKLPIRQPAMHRHQTQRSESVYTNITSLQWFSSSNVYDERKYFRIPNSLS